MQAGIEALRRIIEPVVESLGYELVHVELTGMGNEQILRVYIDAPGGILVDDCATVSRQLSLVMDVEDPLSSTYFLEVSSPGLDRPLVTRAHFERFIGHRVQIVMQDHIMGRKRFKGELCELDGDTVVVEVDGEQYDLPFADIRSARLESEI